MDRDGLNRYADLLLNLAGRCEEWRSGLRWDRQGTEGLEKSVESAISDAEVVLERVRDAARTAAGKALVAADKTS